MAVHRTSPSRQKEMNMRTRTMDVLAAGLVVVLMAARLAAATAAGKATSARPHRSLCAALLLLALAGRSMATTWTVTFEPQQEGTRILTGGPEVPVDLVGMPDGPEVFLPSLSPYSAPKAIRGASPCTTTSCNSLTFEFDRALSSFSLRVGNDDDPFATCFPEGNTCDVWAVLQGYDELGGLVATSAPGFVLGGPGGRSPIDRLLDVSDADARIRRAVVYFGSNLPAGYRARPWRPQVDHLVLVAPDAPPPPPPPPTPPVVFFTEPKPYAPWDYFDFPWEIAATTGSIDLGGGSLTDLCLQVNDHPLTCGLAGQTTVTGGTAYFNLAIPAQETREGLNRLLVIAQTVAGSGSAEVYFELPYSDDDIRVTAMEVTQSIQQWGLPLNVNGTAQYNGVRLAEGGKTVVRIFADRLRGKPAPLAGVQAFLRGSTFDAQGREIPLGLLFPDYKPSLVRGSLVVDVSPDVRAHADGAYVFTLPTSWTERSSTLTPGGRFPSRHVIKLTAEVNPPWFGSPAAECSSCGSNNVFALEEIGFDGQTPILISPVRITFTNALGFSIAPPTDPASVFAGMATISPIAEAGGLRVAPYVSTIDVTDLLGQANLRDRIFDRVARAEIADFPGYTVGVAQLDPLETFNGGVEAPVPYVWPPRVEPVSLVTTGQRQLSNVAHEVYHALGRLHAGLACDCGIDTTAWPPDERGRIAGVGLDRRANSGGTGRYRIIAPGFPGQPSEWVDIMSYCVSGFAFNTSPAHLDEFNAWISIRNWQAFGSAVPDIPAPIGCSELTLSTGSAAWQPPTGRTVRVVARMDADGFAEILRAEPGDGRYVVTDDASPFMVIVFGSSLSDIVSITRVPARPVHDPDGYLIAADVPAEDASGVLLVHDQFGLVAYRARTANPPTVAMIAPAGGTQISDTGDVVVSWNGSDVDGDPLEAVVDYSADDGTSFRVVSVGAGATGGTSEVRLPARLFRFSDRARVRVTLNDGFDATSAISDPFTVVGTPPLVRITEPSQAASVREDSPLHLVGEAFDDAGDPIPDASLEWRIRGELVGRGSVVDVLGLAAGTYTIELGAADSRGRTANAEVTVTLTGRAGLSSACAARVRKAAGKAGKSALSCHAKAIAKNLPVDLVCLSKTRARFGNTARKACGSPMDGILDVADSCVALLVGDVPGTDTCAAKSITALGKSVAATLGCSAKKSATPGTFLTCAGRATIKLQDELAGAGTCTEPPVVGGHLERCVQMVRQAAP